MELKTPTKKGIKTPRSRPPLPILNESYSGYCIDEYDWPMFTGYYNGTSVIVDDSQAMTLLTNKGFFGKGSLSKGCPNVAKRKIPVNVVYESQWKRRKMWIESLINILHESRKKCNEPFEGNGSEADKKESNDIETMEIDNEKNGSLQNDLCKTEKNSCETRENDDRENSQNKSNQTSKDNMADSDHKKGSIEEIIELDIETNNSTKIEEKQSVTREDENKSVLNSKDNMVDDEYKNGCIEEIVDLDNEKNDSKKSVTSEDKDNRDSKNKSVLTSKDNTVDSEYKKGSIEEIIDLDNETNNSTEIEEKQSATSEDKDNGDSKNKSGLTSKDNRTDSEYKKGCIEIIELDKEKNNSTEIEEKQSATGEDKDNGDGKSKSVITSKDNSINSEYKTGYIEIIELDNEKNNSTEIEEKQSATSEDKDNGDCKNKSVLTSKDNTIDIDNKSCDLEKMVVENERNNSQNICQIDEEQSDTIRNEENGDSKVLPDTNQIIKETEVHIGPSKNDENIQDANKLITNNVKVDDDHQSKCIKKIDLSNNTEKGILNINEVLVIPDTDGDLEQYFLNLKPYVEEEKVKTAIEVLYLTLEEAFFLSYACNCLQIFDLSSNILQSKDLWVLFQESQPDFIEKYVAYHYFRAKGWVVKTGTKFGGDFLLYKKGPLYFHASYIVIVEVLKNNENSRSKLTWQKIVGINRMAESANKEILICHVQWPDMEKDKFNDPAILKEFGVTETLLRRWLPTQEKTPDMQNQ